MSHFMSKVVENLKYIHWDDEKSLYEIDNDLVAQINFEIQQDQDEQDDENQPTIRIYQAIRMEIQKQLSKINKTSACSQEPKFLVSEPATLTSRRPMETTSSTTSQNV